MSKKLVFTLAAVMMLASLILSACGGVAAPADDKKLVGISMPTKASTRWISDGESMVKSFEALGLPPTCSSLTMTSRIRSPRSKTWLPRVPMRSRSRPR